MPPRFAAILRTYALPVLLVGVAYAAKRVAEPWTGPDAPFLFLLGAVTLSAYLADLTGGLLALALALVASILLIEPRFAIFIADDHDLVQVYSFAAEAFVIIGLCVGLRRSRLRAEASADETRALQRQVLESVESEQRRIGQDLHDDLGQHLTAIALSGELLARKLDRAGATIDAAECRDLVHRVNDGVNRTRQLARGLSPMTLDPDSLPLLLAELQERSAEAGRLAVTFDITGTPPPDLRHDTVLHLYRIAQEAVANAMRHSGGTRVEITLACEPHCLALTVRDDGEGMHPGKPDARRAATSREGMGLRVMAFRARSIGGTFRISAGRADAAPHGPHVQHAPSGTSVTCELSLPPEGDPP